MLGIEVLIVKFTANGNDARQRLGSVVNDRQRWSELVVVGELLQCTRDRGFVGLMHRTNMFEPLDETPTHDPRTFPHLRGCLGSCKQRTLVRERTRPIVAEGREPVRT